MTPDEQQDPVVVLHSGQTLVDELTEEQQQVAVRAAFLLTCSPHEWQWSTDQQVLMAAYVLWAHQRLEAVKQIVTRGINRE
ncbi:MAG: hypothetical protein KDI37_08660 [Xanthomonadales bacterium]|nr:hypothetical protein [Xanthomonadales bacterium]